MADIDMSEQFQRVIGRRLVKAEPTGRSYYECGVMLHFDDGARLQIEYAAGGGLSDVTYESGSFDVFYLEPSETPHA